MAFWAKGTMLSQNGTAICALTNVPGPQRTRNMLNTTSHCTTDDYAEYIAGLKEGGVMNVSGWFTPADPGMILMEAAFEDGTIDDYTVDFPDEVAAQFAFKALVSQAPSTSSEVEGIIEITAALQITGKPTLNLTYSTGLTTPFFSTSVGTIVPAPAGNVYQYAVNVVTGTTSITITPTGAGVITVDGNVVASGVASSAITLGAAGSITPVEIVVKETNKIARTYYVDIVRAA